MLTKTVASLETVYIINLLLTICVYPLAHSKSYLLSQQGVKLRKNSLLAFVKKLLPFIT